MHDNISTVTSDEYRKNRQSALEALGAYQKRGHVSNQFNDIVAQLHDESDRGVVVILGSLIEDLLLDLLLEKFQPLTPSKIKNLTRSGGLLANFDDRINLAEALGVIDADMVDSIQIMKAMRNACAHSRQDITFTTPELANVLALLFDDEVADTLRTTDGAEMGRIAYVTYFLVISEMLKGQPREIAQLQRQLFFNRVRIAVRDEIQPLQPETSPDTR